MASKRKLSLLALLAIAHLMCVSHECFSAEARVVEVSSTTRLTNITPGYEDMFRAGRSSKFRFEPASLPAEQQGQEFFVRWRGASVDRVKFEYRQVNKPNTILEQVASPSARNWTLFQIIGESHRESGHVSAWRVTLWAGESIVAEKRSALW